MLLPSAGVEKYKSCTSHLVLLKHLQYARRSLAPPIGIRRAALAASALAQPSVVRDMWLVLHGAAHAKGIFNPPLGSKKPVFAKQ